MIFTELTFNKCLSKLDSINAILFFQQNFGLASEMADKIKQNFAHDEIVVLDFQDIEKNFSSVLQENLCDSFFSSSKIIKVYNFKPNGRSKLKDELLFLNKNNYKNKIVLFFAPELDGKSSFKTFFEKGDSTASIACYGDDENKAKQCIQNFFSEKSIAISQQAICLMAKMLHGDRKTLISECEKMAIYSNNNEITIEDVENIIVDNSVVDPITFVDNLLAGNIKQAVFEFEILKKDCMSIIPLIRIFIQSVELLLSIKTMVQDGIDVNTAMKSKFVFWKRIPLLKIAIANTTIGMLEKYIAIAIQVEKVAKLYNENIALNYFDRKLILSRIR
jgi:DNA polymerase-3 subunit delta